MASERPGFSKTKDAFSKVLDGDYSAFLALMPESPVAFATIMIAFLGVLVQEKFGMPVSKSDLAAYARSLHQNREGGDVPSILMLETTLRASMGEVPVLDEIQSEQFYEALGLLVRSILHELILTDDVKSDLLFKADLIIQHAIVDEE